MRAGDNDTIEFIGDIDISEYTNFIDNYQYCCPKFKEWTPDGQNEYIGYDTERKKWVDDNHNQTQVFEFNFCPFCGVRLDND